MASSVDIIPALGAGLLMSQVGPAAGYSAWDERRQFPDLFLTGEGVATYNSFRVSQRAAGPTMTVDVNMDERAWIRGDAITLQGSYAVPPHASTINVDISAADASNPRIDLVVVEVKDSAHDASGSNLARVRVVAGTPTSGATLDTRTGAAALPASSLHLADVLVAASDTSISDAEIRDRRPFIAGIPPLLSDFDMAPLVPQHVELASVGLGTVDLFDLNQAAVLVRLDRRLVGATRIRWRYDQGTVTAAAGNYVLALFDTSGRKIIDTGSVAFTGASSSAQTRSETIAATTFEPGLYYAFIGVDTSAGNAKFFGARIGTGPTTADPPSPGCPNVGLFSATGGVTVPTTLAGMTDIGLGAGLIRLGVPSMTLSVG